MNFFISRLMIIADKIAANASHSGKLHHTPHIGCSVDKKLSGDDATVDSHSNSNGKHKIQGMRKMTCLVKLKKIAFGAIPMEV